VIGHILVPLDGSQTAERALRHGALLARTLDADLTLARVPEPTVVPVMSGAVWVTEEVGSQRALEEAERYLASVAERPELNGVRVATVTPGHPVATGLLQTVEQHGVDLVVITTHGYAGFKRWVFGSVADKLIGSASVPVYVVREDNDTAPAPPALQTVLVPLDGSTLAETALDSAAFLAHRAGARVLLVQVPTVPGFVTSIPETAGWIPRFLREQATEAAGYLAGKARALADAGLQVDSHVEVVTAGGVADGILTSARRHDADVIVMSTHGRSGIGRWVFGSVADQVLRNADRPVWLVRVRAEREGGAAAGNGGQ